MNLLLVALAILVTYLILVIILRLRFKPQLEKYNLSFWGPLLFWRTKRGRKFIDKLATCKRFWNFYATLSLLVLFITMFLILGMLFLSAYLATLPAARPMPIENALVLPGINPIIPLWYGLIALIIAVIIHEFAHGILARVAEIKIKSMGAVMFVIPLGAFVEPDEEKLRSCEKIKRDRIFAAGPGTNIFVGLLCAMIFAWGFMGSLEPAEDGVLLLSVTEDYPADVAGMEKGMIIVYIEGNTTNGTRLPGINITEKKDFNDFFDKTHANDTVNITVYHDGEYLTFDNISLMDKGEYYPGYPEFEGKGFLGIGSMDAQGFIDILSKPVRSAGGDRAQRRSNVMYFAIFLPIEGNAMPLREPLTDVLEVQGALAALPEDVFWFLANTFYYLFWLNILVGIFNALPAVPLDGGYPYRDAWDSVLKRLRKGQKPEDREVTVNKITVYTALLVLFLLMWTIFIPHLL